MKRLLISFWLFSLLVLCSVSTLANTETAFEVSDAKLNVWYEFNEQNIIVNAVFSDINVKDGIISLEYDIIYDSEALELVEAKHTIPETWQKFISEETVENFSSEYEKGRYFWGYAVIELGEGAKLDGELGITLEFKPLNNTVSNIDFVYSDLRGEIVENGETVEFVHMSSNSARITFDPLNSKESKLYYKHFDPKAEIRTNYTEVGNQPFNIVQNDVQDDNIDVWECVAYFSISVIVIIFLVLIVYIFLKSKRG